MIKASSSGDHLDCFFAGDSAGCADRSLFAGIDGAIAGAVGAIEIGAGTDVALARMGGIDVFGMAGAVAAAVVAAADTGGAGSVGGTGVAEAEVVVGVGVAPATAAAAALVTRAALLLSSSSSSSSCGFRRSEISTLAVGI